MASEQQEISRWDATLIRAVQSGKAPRPEFMSFNRWQQRRHDFGDRLPGELERQRQALIERLGKAPPEWRPTD